MRSRLLPVAIVSLLFLSVFGSVATATPASTPASDGTVVVDNDTRILSSSFDEDTGEVTLVVESDRVQPVTVTDASQQRAGPLSEISYIVEPGTTRIRANATQNDGYVAVSIDAAQGDHLIVVRDRDTGLDATTFVVIGWAVSVGMIALAVYRREK